MRRTPRRSFLTAIVIGVCSVGTSHAEDCEPPRLEPPTVSRETTYFLGPLDEHGFVDYVEALNRAAPDYGIANEHNAYVGILQQLDTSEWDADYREAHYAQLGLNVPAEPPPAMFDFSTFVEKQDLGDDVAAVADEQFAIALERPWTEQEAPMVARWIEATSPQLDAISASLRRRGYFVPLTRVNQYETVVDILLPHLGHLRDIGRAFNARAFQHLAEGRVEHALRDIESMTRLGRLITQEHMVITQLVAISIEAMALDAIRVVLLREELSQRAVASLRGSRRRLPARRSMTEEVDTERVMMLDAMTSIVRGLNSDFTAFEVGMLGMIGAGLKPRHVMGLGHALRMINQTFDRLSNPPRRYADIKSWSEEIDSYLEEQAMEPGEILAVAHLIAHAADRDRMQSQRCLVTRAVTNLILQTVVPAIAASFSTDRQFRANAELVDLGLALRAYDFDHCDYPNTLEALVPAYVEAIPLDFATGEPLRYERRGEGVVVYSVGRDGEDDGGRHDLREGDVVVALP